MPHSEKTPARRHSRFKAPDSERELSVDEYFDADVPKANPRPYDFHGPTHEEVKKWPSDS